MVSNNIMESSGPTKQIDNEKGLTERNPQFTFTKEEEKVVIRKLDWNLLPLIFVLYSLSILDRSNLGNARISGLGEDIDLSGRRYTWLATVFYISYILSQWTTIGWKAFKPHNWVAFSSFAWGLISTLQAATRSWEGLMVCRVFLGITEAMFSPGIALYLSYFYPREQVGFRVGVFLSGSALANAYGGALAYAISHIRGSISPWRILLIVEGIPSCLLSVIVWYFMPDAPDTARFLNEREKKIAVDISLRQPGDRETKGLQLKQVLWALKDYRTYIPALMYAGCNVSFASLPLFIPTIIKELGVFSTIQSNGLSAPPYILCFITIITVCYFSDRLSLRGPFAAASSSVAAIGFLCLAISSSVAVRYFSLFLAVQIFVSVAMIYTWVGNSQETDSKRAGALAVLATAGQCGPVLGTNIFPASEGPFYRKGMWISFGMCLMVTVVSLLNMWVLWRENRRRDTMLEVVDGGKGDIPNGDTDRTDVEDAARKHQSFRYML
ncbi:hypothetical protein PABG_02528 [Paracoccidioides brasiliensis Pb03]|nr:hypothetical protein PABG_02528 [Paracoccidioides brasiliensis Pb03]